ncbi:MAG TPA: universal stress protein [Ktedonobacteraceae bacterium]
MFQHVLVPLDGSVRAERAIHVAARLVRASGGTLTLLRIVTYPAHVEYLPAAPTMSGIYLFDQQKAIEEAQWYLKQLVLSRSELQGLQVVTNVYSGVPAQMILRYAQAENVDLIVMCSHGDTGFRRWMLGSVALQVSRHAAMPVMVLNAHGDVTLLGQPSAERPLRVLLALDGSPLAESALVPAAQLCAALAAPAQGVLHLVIVAPLLQLIWDREDVSGHVHKEHMEAARLYLDEVEQRLREGDLAQLNLAVSSSVVGENDVADVLIRVAEQGEYVKDLKDFRGCDMIAMATHGRSGLTRWTMGSITERVLGATRLPLLVVRPHPSKTEKKASEAEKHIPEPEQTSWVGLF